MERADDIQKRSILINIQAANQLAYKGPAPVGPMKIAELELVRDGLYFWHCLFALFRLKSSFRPYEDKKDFLPQPSIDDHKALFGILKINLSSNPNNYFLFHEQKEALLTSIRKKKKEKERDVNSLKAQTTTYFTGILENIEISKKLFPLDKECTQNIQDIESRAKKDREKQTWSGFSEDVTQTLTIFQETMKKLFEKLQRESLGIRFPFAQKFFGENRNFWQSEQDFKLEFPNDLFKRYSFLSDQSKSLKTPQDLKIFRTNIVTANLYIKSGDQYQYIEISYDQEPVLSPFSFPNEMKDIEMAVEARFEENESTKEILKDCPSYELHHSEKALIASINVPTKLKQLVTRLKKKLRGGKPELLEPPLKIDEIGLQIFSTRDYCNWCESFLSDEFRPQYQQIKELLEEDKDIIVDGPGFLKKYCSSSFEFHSQRSGSQLDNKDKYVIDHSYKSYFQEGLLKEFLNSYQDCSSENRTYFLSDLENMTEKRKDQMDVIRKAKDMYRK